jgi:large subunit ribosomal protein L29
MQISEIRGMSTSEIEGKVDDAREELFKLRFQFKTGQLTDYSRIVEGRHSIARLLTVLRERQLAEQLAAAAQPAAPAQPPAAGQPAGEGEKA